MEELKNDISFQTMNRLTLDPDYILNRLSKIVGVPVEAIKTKSRKREIVICRQIACALLHGSTTLQKIAEMVGTKDHSMVLYNVKSFNDKLKFDKDFKKIYHRYKTEYLYESVDHTDAI
jgi:chromosomal replication initiator protein